MAVEATLRGEPLFSDQKSGYVITKALVDGKLGVVKGNIPGATDGKKLFLEGFWASGKGQPTFQVTAALEPQLIGDRAQVETMEKWGIPGLNRQLAERLFDRFDGEPIATIAEFPAEILGVSGVSSDMGEKITFYCFSEFNRTVFRRNIIAAGVPLTQSDALSKSLNDDQVRQALENPFYLFLFAPEVGLGATDRFARICKKEDPRGRIAALALRQVLGALNHLGSTKCRRSDARRAKSKDRLAAKEFDVGLQQCIETGAVLELGEFIQPRSTYQAELRIVNEVARLLEAPVKPHSVEAVTEYVKGPIQKAGKIAGGQLDAVSGLAKKRFGILHGKPGVGKSVTAEALIQTIINVYGIQEKDVVLLGPTAKAAQRLTETTGRPASTIHRALECNNRGVFNRCKDKPLQGELFIVDEMSMADTGLCAALLEAIPDSAFCYWLGDPNQQPSVAPGRVLHDMIQNGNCNDHELTKTWRQGAGSAIVDACADIVRRQVPDLSNTHPAGDFRFIETKSDEEAFETIVKINRALSSKVGPSEVAVLTPLNNSTVGQVPLNARLQQTHNPTPSECVYVNGRQLGVGDIVIQQQNNYQLGIYNGDEGVILSADDTKRYLRVQFGGRIVGIGGKGLNDLALGYARTVHKSQGGEYAYVITTALDSEEFALNLNGLNTAVSRGKRMVVVVGSKEAIARGVLRSAVEDRNTDLQSKLMDRLGAKATNEPKAPEKKRLANSLRPPARTQFKSKETKTRDSEDNDLFGDINFQTVATDRGEALGPIAETLLQTENKKTGVPEISERARREPSVDKVSDERKALEPPGVF